MCLIFFGYITFGTSDESLFTEKLYSCLIPQLPTRGRNILPLRVPHSDGKTFIHECVAPMLNALRWCAREDINIIHLSVSNTVVRDKIDSDVRHALAKINKGFEMFIVIVYAAKHDVF